MLNISQLESSLWEAADQLRANSKLNANEYSMPVLGLIFLRHATNRFNAVKAEIEKGLSSRGGKKRPITIDDFKGKSAIFLPIEAQYDRILNLAENADIGKAINAAMKAIEDETQMLQGVLPKEYTSFEQDLLYNLVRIFDREELRTATGDVFGRIYEYFLNKFAISGAQEGGEFFTPPSLVRTIVNMIEPDRGNVLDPACASAGMFVQPCTLWFFDKGKPAERQDKVLMIDARNVYRVVTRKIRDFSEEQLQNITAIAANFEFESGCT